MGRNYVSILLGGFNVKISYYEIILGYLLIFTKKRSNSVKEVVMLGNVMNVKKLMKIMD